jgi:predicted amidophosphoribosyltransferase
MFCPLCKSGFRDGLTRCPDCDAPLVAKLTIPGASRPNSQAPPNVPILLWTGKDEAEFSVVADALRDHKIPAFLQEQPRAAFGNRLRPDSQIHILESDLKRALEIADAAVTSLRRTPQPVRECHGCGAEVRVSFTHCPRCGTMLIASKDYPSPDSRPIARADLLFCPICDAQYRTGHTHCTLCGVDLVPESFRGQPLDEKQRSEGLKVVWRGGDPVAVSRAIAALRGARISHHVRPTQDHLTFRIGIPRPRYEVRVFASDAPAAQSLLDPISDAPPFDSLNEPAPQIELVTKQDSPDVTFAAPQSRFNTPPLGLAHLPWKPQQATREIWSSEDSALAQILQDCLAENSIGVRVEGPASGMLRLFVRPHEEAAAREIIREVLEGTPPV